MSPRRRQFRFPYADLSILVAILFIGWAGFWLAEIEPQISRERQQSQQLGAIFTECQELFRESLASPERARREFDLAWYDALVLKAEYLGIADRLQSDLPELEGALGDASAGRARAELPRRIQELKTWIAKQKDRAGLERLDVRSREMKERIAGAQLAWTNSPVELTEDLATLLKETDRAYDSYLSGFKEVAANAGKLLVGAHVAQRLDQARKALTHLSELAQQARRDGRVIGLFLESESDSDRAKRTRRQEEVIRAFLEAGSPAEFTRRIGSQTGTGNASSPASALAAPSVRQARYGLLAALAVLGVFLIVDLYWRGVVMPLRLKLVERDTTIQHREKLAHFEQLAAGLAHEIRNPLTTINARLYTIQRNLPEGTPERKDAMVIGNEINRVNQILKDFIQLTRPSPPDLALLTAEPLLKDVRDLMAPHLHRQGVRLECQSQAQAPFHADPQQLKQVLINLVQNAAESIDQEGVIILRAREGNLPLNGTETKVALIEVEDNGPGIPPEVQGRLFEPFFSTKKDGTGLGLPISARIIDRHGGTLDFETEVGRGTVFRIALPAYEKT